MLFRFNSTVFLYVQVLFLIYRLLERHASRVGYAAASLLSTFPVCTCPVPMNEVNRVFYWCISPLHRHLSPLDRRSTVGISELSSYIRRASK